MFKSFSDSLRSLWQTKAHDTVKIPERKRKRPTDETDLDDSDVEIVSVKKPKQEGPDSSSGLFSFLTVPMSKMSEWVRKKTVRQDHFFVRPIPTDSHWNRNRPVECRDQQRRSNVDGSAVFVPNGSHHSHTYSSTSLLARPPINSQNGANENGVNGDVDVVDRQPGSHSLSIPSSRRTSCSSYRPSVGRLGSVEQCFHLKEREEYLKLLQQHTTVDLGYHGSKVEASHHPGLSAVDRHHSQRKSGAFLPGKLPSTTASSSASSTSSSSLSFMKAEGLKPASSSRFTVTPNRFAPSPTLPSDRVTASCLVSSLPSDRVVADQRPKTVPLGSERLATVPPSGAESFAMPHRPGRAQPFHSGSKALIRHTQRRSSLSEKEKEQYDKQVPPSDADGVIVIEDDGPRKTTRPSPLINFKSSEYLDENWLSKMNSRYATAEMERQQLIKEAETKKKLLEERREGRLGNLDKKLRQQMRLFDEEPEVIEELPLPEVPQKKPLPELTDNMQREINAALDNGPPSQVLAEGFRLQLTRADIATLRGLNWLNDEVINFYMNLLMERGNQDGYAKTYAFNTFFFPKLLQGGHASVKRWTRTVDIFSHQYLVVFMKEKKICYYDSMGGNNNQCINAVRQYLADESVQKRKVQLDLSDWSSEIVKNIPQQMNGSDCGMFSCMYAESITRGAQITFTQKDMPYFRRRMVYEILKKKLLS